MLVQGCTQSSTAWNGAKKKNISKFYSLKQLGNVSDATVIRHNIQYKMALYINVVQKPCEVLKTLQAPGPNCITEIDVIDYTSGQLDFARGSVWGIATDIHRYIDTYTHRHNESAILKDDSSSDSDCGFFH